MITKQNIIGAFDITISDENPFADSQDAAASIKRRLINSYGANASEVIAEIKIGKMETINDSNAFDKIKELEKKNRELVEENREIIEENHKLRETIIGPKFLTI